MGGEIGEKKWEGKLDGEKWEEKLARAKIYGLLVYGRDWDCYRIMT